ncbi:MAG: DUF3971 domain-containing protein [Alphaproteobacteria bacterium]|nr:DUF3971 domain-containing protein [Alphaproteobacteria bacterium]
MKKTFKTFFRIFEFIIAFLIILLLLLFIRLSQGPIQIKNLTPQIIEALTDADKDVQVDMKNAYIELALSRGRLMDIQIQDLMISDNNGFLLNVEKANVSFNPFWLLIGRLSLRDIDLEKPYIQINLDTDVKQQDIKKDKHVGRVLNRVRRYMEKLDTLSVKDGQISLNDADKSVILMPNVFANISKQMTDEITIQVKGDFYLDASFVNWNVDGKYHLEDMKMIFKASVKGVDLKKISKLFPALNDVNFVFDVSMDGSLDLSDLKQSAYVVFEKINFIATSQQGGMLYLPQPVDTTYNIKNIELKGEVLSGLTSLSLKDSILDVDGKTVTVNVLVDDLKKAITNKDFNEILFHLTADMYDIPMTDVPELWPSSLGSSAHDWVKQNVLDGKVSKATLSMKMLGADVTDLNAVLDVDDATVRYVDEMMLAEDVKAQVLFEKNKITINVLNARVGKIKATGGYVSFLDLNQDLPLFDMSVLFEGKIKDGMQVVSTQPLNVCSALFLDCNTFAGNAKGTLDLKFPFLDEGIENEIKFSVRADLDDVGLLLPNTDWSLAQGNLKLFVDNDKLTLDGQALLDDKKLKLDIEHSLSSENVDYRYQLNMPVTVSMLKSYFDHIGDFFKGSLLSQITITPLLNDEMSVDMEFGLKDVEISLPIGYVKEFNKEGLFKANAIIKNNQLFSIPNVYLSIPQDEISIRGRVDLAENMLFKIVLDEVDAPRTQAKMNLSFLDNGKFIIDVDAKSLDISNLVHGEFLSEDNQVSVEPVDFLISGKANKLFLSEKDGFSDVSLTLEKKNGKWEQFSGYLKGATPLTFSLNENKTALDIQTQDVGDFLFRAGFTDRIKGGVLNTLLKQDEKGNLTGELFVENYELTKTSFFTQAATLLGIVDALRGDTISFDKAIIPFTLSSSNDVEIQDAVASGTAVGLTARGTIKSGQIDLSGSVVPAYALNSLPGKIPLVGTLLSGEKGGGLFGVSYSVTGSTNNPEISFNPASLLTPGIFRRLFDAF